MTDRKKERMNERKNSVLQNERERERERKRERNLDRMTIMTLGNIERNISKQQKSIDFK